MKPIEGQQFKEITSALEMQGYIILPSIFPREILDALIIRIKAFEDTDLKPAKIGRGKLKQKNPEIRRNKIYWLDKHNITDNGFLSLMELLRVGLNQSLYLGLFDYEAHYAIYHKGDFYKQHVDALKGSSNRVLSTVLYLNDEWNADAGGELVLYAQDEKTILEIVVPNVGKLVMFLSEQFPHEVLAANKDRYSIAGWFRVNASNSQTVDPLL